MSVLCEYINKLKYKYMNNSLKDSIKIISIDQKSILFQAKGNNRSVFIQLDINQVKALTQELNSALSGFNKK